MSLQADAFVEGARWWSQRQGRIFIEEIARLAVKSRVRNSAITRLLPVAGTWPADHPRRYFVAGVSWEEFTMTGATLWASDRILAEDEAERRYPLTAAAEEPTL